MKYQVITEDNMILIESENEQVVTAWVLNNCYRNRDGWFFGDQKIHRAIKRSNHELFTEISCAKKSAESGEECQTQYGIA